MDTPQIKEHDFYYMWRGIKKKALTKNEASCLAPIHISNQNHRHALLLIHGFASSPAVYRYMLPLLTGYDAIICKALPGHASNFNEFSKTKAIDWVQAVESTYDELLPAYEKIDVLGLSLGGLLACHLAKTRKIHRLFLLAPALSLKINIQHVLFYAKVLQFFGINRIPNQGGNILSREHSELTYRQLAVSTITELLNMIKTFSYTPPNCPVDVFLGEYDKVVNVKQIAQTLEKYPQTTVHWLKHSAHVLPLDADMEDIVNYINNQQK
jgi:carboxylesterase